MFLRPFTGQFHRDPLFPQPEAMGVRSRASSSSLLEFQGEGHLEEALDEYDEAIRLDLQTAPGYNNRGSAYNGWGSSSGPLRIMVHEIGFPCFEARIPVTPFFRSLLGVPR